MRFLLIALSVAVLVIRSASGRETMMRFDLLEYSVADFPSMPQLLRVDGNGHARYESHTNEFTPDLPEIGVYESDLTAAEMNTITALVETSSFKALPDHWGQADSGDRFRRLRVHRANETVEKLVGTDQPVDPNLQQIFDQLDKIITAVRAHPVRALRLTLAEVSLNQTGRWEAALILTNIGSQTLHCWKPSRQINPDSALHVELWPKRPSVAARPEDLRTAQVEVLDKTGAQSTGVSIIELAPSQSTSVRIEAKLPLEKAGGTFMSRVSYANMAAPGADGDVITGEVFSKRVEVVAR